MEQRKPGNTTLTTAPLIFGGNVFGWTLNDQESFDMIDAWLDAGYNAIDTADFYSRWAEGHSGGESEAVLGRYFRQRGNRDRIMLTSKVGMDLGDGKKGLGKERIMHAIEQSLQRLQTDYLDLYLSHRDDPDTPLEETLDAYMRLIEQGKVRYIGASNYTGARLEEALDISQRQALPRYEVLQPFYNLYDRFDYEQDLAPVARKHGIGVTPYFSLASGFLTGKYRSREDARGKSREQFVDKYFDERGMRILDALDSVAERLDASPASVSLAWLMAQPTVTAPIVSATSANQLAQLRKATEITLDDDALDQLNQASAER
ncbi:aldo/keto reductase [Kushneria phosphatilytica]|uniref:Aldo/keto reductase n=1 Tax=Kushneria phosphatilytica TaxID=657387 RepID=A0A1S1NR89_9GAMM|nr:aldo/keto reductase [Kushneria phosphatilytica]OHV07574.1 alcohol dehydrogenase [Kushneria phosphatilytica]QEL10059.1 aldo/keto reductase [Kushneria phosphatilytica]